MATRILVTLYVISGFMISGAVYTYAAETHAPYHGVQLSPDLQKLLREEMLEIAGGVQGIGLALATANWESIQETSAKVRDSYIMEKKLTPAQAKELEQSLPAPFKQIDLEFHQRAERLGAAAAAHDPELVAFQFFRLLGSCVACHSVYAKSRFPGFASPVQQGHRH